MVTKERPSRLLSIPEAAKFLGRGEMLVRRAVEDGQIPSVMLGARRWVSMDNLIKALEGTLQEN